MSELSKARINANAKYNKKCKNMAIRYTPDELSEYERMQRYIAENGGNLSAYVKQLIKNDLDSKGY